MGCPGNPCLFPSLLFGAGAVLVAHSGTTLTPQVECNEFGNE